MCSIEQEKNSYIFCGKKKNHQICGGGGRGRGGKKNAGHNIWGASRLQLVREICD
jgi:hypothetical protein